MQTTDPDDLKNIVRIYHYRHDNSIMAEWADEHGSSRTVRWNIGHNGDDRLLLGEGDIHAIALPILSTVTGKRFRISESLARDGVTVWEREDYWKGTQSLAACPAVN